MVFSQKKQKDVVFDSISAQPLTLSSQFCQQFPVMSGLLQQATIIEFIINSNQRFRQYLWTDHVGQNIGWLCRLEHIVPQDQQLIDEHILLVKNMGGIIDSWANEDEQDCLIDNNISTFCLKESTIGIGGWEENYYQQCQDEDLIPLDCSQLVAFALKANGDVTCYHHQTKQILLFAHDGYSPFEIELVSGQPECTLYQFSHIHTFTDYVEALASQWLAKINGID